MSFLLDRQAGEEPAALWVTPLQKIVPARDHTLYLQAEGVLAQARARAARWELRARAGFQAELARGYEEGRVKAQAELAAQLVALDRRTAAFLAGVEKELADLVVAAMRKVVAGFDDRDRILAAVRGGLAMMRRQKQVVLKLHSEDAQFLREQMADVTAGFPGVGDIDVVCDDRLARGECRLESAIGTVDVSLDAQIDILARAFVGAAAAAVDAGGEGARAATEDCDV